MDLGTTFLTSKIARRFCLLFIFCAFLPTVALVVLAYTKVIQQLEQQSLVRLKREARAYTLTLFDRMIRLDHSLQALGREIQVSGGDPAEVAELYRNDLEPIFSGIVMVPEGESAVSVFGAIDASLLAGQLAETRRSAEKPFLLTLPRPGQVGLVVFGANFRASGQRPFTILGQAKTDYLWGVGANPLLPPMTELAVFDGLGRNIITSDEGVSGNYSDQPAQQLSREPGVYRYQRDGQVYYTTNPYLFIESRFQKTDLVIVFSQAKADMMSSLDSFNTSFPFVILLFLLLILYLSVRFIRRGLEPLEQLKAATRRVARQDFSTQVQITSDDEFEDLGRSFNEMASKLDAQFHTLSVLGEIDRAILSSYDRSQILHTAAQGVTKFFGCDAVFLVQRSTAEDQHVKVQVLVGRGGEDPTVEYHLLVDDDRAKLFAAADHAVYSSGEGLPGLLTRLGHGPIASFLLLPLSGNGKIDHVLILGWRKPRPLPEDELGTARQIANQLMIALTNARLLEEMESLAMGTVEALARTVDAKSKWTAGHSERVAVLAGRIAKVMGLSDLQINTITRGGLLHDIGKIGCPIAILNKPGQLADHELAEIRKHPEIGGKILEPIKPYQDILPLVVHHHEKYDGTGYPDGLKGEEIDLRARILAVADVWDALISERPYRQGVVQDHARQIIIDGAGSHFDPRVVEAFLTVVVES